MGGAAGDDLPESAAGAERGGSGLFDGVFARGGAAAAASDAGWIGAMLSVERALARAEAAAGVITAERAAEIDRACGEANVDAASIGRAAAESGNPVIPLVAAIEAHSFAKQAGRNPETDAWFASRHC